VGTISTGPWDLASLEAHLGAPKRIRTQTFTGDEIGRSLDPGPYAFACGCIATRGGISFDLHYLTPCSTDHAALVAIWNTEPIPKSSDADIRKGKNEAYNPPGSLENLEERSSLPTVSDVAAEDVARDKAKSRTDENRAS